jgi:Sap, sulfolipid-1-addressing protein
LDQSRLRRPADRRRAPRAGAAAQAESAHDRPETTQHRPILPGRRGWHGLQPHDLALYTPALALIAGSGLLLRQQALAALVILLITLMVAWVPLVLAAVVPGASTRLLPWLGGWMTANNRWIQVILGFGFGIWLLVKGVNGL